MVGRDAPVSEERSVDAVRNHDAFDLRPEAAEQPLHRKRNGDELTALAQTPEDQLATKPALLGEIRLEVAGMTMNQHVFARQSPQRDESDFAIEARVPADVDVDQLWPPPE